MTDKTNVKGSGWASFAATILLLGALLNIIAGISGLAAKDKFNEDAMLWQNIRGVAIFFLVIGLLQLTSAVLIHKRSQGGRILGIFVALTTTCAWFFALDVRPAWALTMIGLGVLVMYSLTVSAAAFADTIPTDFDESATNIPHGA